MLEAMMQPQRAGSQTIQPIVVFNWGAKRSVAANIVNLNVEEQSFDTGLNPTRATVNLMLKVLDVSEAGGNTGAKNVCQTHQTTRTALVDVYKVQTRQCGSTAGVTTAVSGSATTSIANVASATNLKSATTKVKTIKTSRIIKSR